MIVRHPTEGELERAAEIGYIAFSGSNRDEWVKDFSARARMFGLEYILVVELDGKLVSSLMCTPGPIWCGGDIVTHSAVGGVGTIPEARKNGCAGAMMAETVRFLRRQGIHTSSLWPFSYPYYRKFGWEVGSERRKYSGKPEAFAALGDPANARIAFPDDLPIIIEAYNRLASRYSGLTVRNEAWWNGLIKACNIVLDGGPAQVDGRRRIYLVGDDKPQAYAVSSIREMEGPQTGVHVDEIFSDDPLLLSSLLSFIARQKEADEMTVHTPCDDLLLHQLPEPRDLELKYEPGHQFRVIDPSAALVSRKPGTGVKGFLGFQLTDPVFSKGWRFTAELDGEAITVSKDKTRNELSTSVQMFARMFSGYLRPNQAVALGRASVSSEEALYLAEAAFRQVVPFRSLIEPG